MDNVLVQHITRTPGLVGGKPHIVGHRIRVMDIVVWYEQRGMTPDQIVDLYPGITLSDVHAALAYFFDHRAELEEDFRRESSAVDHFKARYPSRKRSAPVE